MHWDEKKHPRHKANGRFRDKAGSDATAYAKRISAKIAASRGEKNDDDGPTAAEKRAMGHLKAGTRMRPGKKAAPAKKAAPRKAAAKKAPAKKAPAKAQSGEFISAKATADRVEEAKDIVLGMRGASQSEIDAELHPRLKNVSTGRLRAMIEHLNGEKALYNQVVAKAIERLIDKRGD